VVPDLGTRELTVEVAEIAGRERRAEQAEPLAAAGLGDGGREQAVEEVGLAAVAELGREGPSGTRSSRPGRGAGRGPS
jgi:hypothetical protein